MRHPSQVTCLVFGGFTIALWGCAPQAAPIPLAAPTTRTHRARVASAQADTFRQAAALYKAKEYAGALKRVNQLLAATSDEGQRRFLLKQQALCQAALSGKPAATAMVSSVRASSVPVADADCGPRALREVCDALHIPADMNTLRRAAKVTKDGTTLANLKRAAQSVGLKADGVQMDTQALQNLRKPAVVWVDGNHYVALLRVEQNPLTGDYGAVIHDPNKAAIETISLPDLLSRSGGILLTLEKETR